MSVARGRMAVGGFAWLLRHELRLALRGTGPRRGWFARMLPLILLATVPTLGGIALAWAVTRQALPLARYAGFAGAGIAALLVLMLSTAAIAVLRTFHDRHDLDLLLSAPIPPSRILAAKAVGVAVTVAAPFTLFVAPFALTAALRGEPRFLGTLAMVGVDATIATAVALGVTGVLFDALGARRARVAVQLGAAITGGAAFLLTQARSISPGLADRLYAAIARPLPSPLDWPGRATVGAPLPLAAMIALAALAAWGATRFAARHLAASEAAAAARPARSRPFRFRGGLTRIVVAKELRLIARDPELITQIALRLVYLIPLGALIVNGGGAGAGPVVAAAATAAAGLLASSLAWIVVCAEDAPDLLAVAPASGATVERAKLLAACLVPAGLAAVAAVAILPAAPWAAAVTIVMGSVAAITAALLQAWFGTPQPRAAFRRRQSGSFVVGVGEVVLAGAWSGTATLLARASVWAVVPALLAGMILAGAIEARPRR